MKIAILATGDEVVTGDTLNTNAQQLAHSLHAEGLHVGLHMVVSDDELEILQCIDFLAKAHDVILIIGGLGPTSDDRTRFALARYLKEELVEHPLAIDHIQNRLKSLNLVMTKGNRQQALFPRHAELLPNPQGTAVGCYYKHHSKEFVLLPGPPRECLPMFQQSVLPKLLPHVLQDQALLKWLVFGVAEGQIAQQIDDALKPYTCTTGYRLDTPYVECKVRCRPEIAEEIRQIVESITQPHIITPGIEKASQVFLKRMIDSNKTIIIQDEVTGGLLQTILQKPFNIDSIHFLSAKTQSPTFHFVGLENYWQNQAANGHTELIVHYNLGGNCGTERHMLAYRSPLVVHAAAEWVCYRMAELLFASEA